MRLTIIHNNMSLHFIHQINVVIHVLLRIIMYLSSDLQNQFKILLTPRKIKSYRIIVDIHSSENEDEGL